MNQWWTKSSEGTPAFGALYKLEFGPSFQWSGVVTSFIPAKAFELKMIKADNDWKDTVIGFDLKANFQSTKVTKPTSTLEFLLIVGQCI
jgi:hypothetical protein